MGEPILALKSVRKSYAVGLSTETEELYGIDLELERGGFGALVGPSGSGKSRLLNIIGLLDRPTDGELVVASQKTSERDDAQNTHLRGHRIGFVSSRIC